ncbi:(2Fe-2S)-binding protein, partial [Myxococcota bacterium]|nr:(2Fe-2S)-binding protein [Myxococcota bacterium]
GCDEGYCGTCGVLINGRLLNSCMIPAAQVDGCTIVTSAGIGSIFDPHPIQQALVDESAVQCGFCTPGIVVAGKTLLDEIADPTEVEIKEALDGNLCRCTGYVKPLKAIDTAAKMMAEAEK